MDDELPKEMMCLRMSGEQNQRLVSLAKAAGVNRQKMINDIVEEYYEAQEDSERTRLACRGAMNEAP